MEPELDREYCRQCYQYDPERGGWANGCRVCLGYRNRGLEACFAVAFLVETDDGVKDTDWAGPTSRKYQPIEPLQEATRAR